MMIHYILLFDGSNSLNIFLHRKLYFIFFFVFLVLVIDLKCRILHQVLQMTE